MGDTLPIVEIFILRLVLSGTGPLPLLKILDQTDGPTVAPTVAVARIHIHRVEVEFVSVARIESRRRPIVAARTNTVHRRSIAVATARKRHNAHPLEGGELLRRVGVA